MNVRRNTIQRQIILKALERLHTHPTAEEVYLEIHENHPSISKATVYRNLRQLAERGEISRIFLSDESDRFDGRVRRHYHFKCKSCGGICDVDVAYLEEIDKLVENRYGFKVDRHDLVFQGVCKECFVKVLT